MRPIPKGVQQSLHHLIPKLKGGKSGPVALLHHICHKEIHARFTEAQLARQYNTIDALRAAPEMQGFLTWIIRRPPEFTSRVKGGRR